MTDMRRGRLMQGAKEDHTAWKLRVRVAHCPPPPVARKLSYPSWKVIVSAYMANTLSRALTSPVFFRGERQLENKTAVIAKNAATKAIPDFLPGRGSIASRCLSSKGALHRSLAARKAARVDNVSPDQPAA
jgi:hypothetical protein